MSFMYFCLYGLTAQMVNIIVIVRKEEEYNGKGKGGFWIVRHDSMEVWRHQLMP